MRPRRQHCTIAPIPRASPHAPPSPPAGTPPHPSRVGRSAALAGRRLNVASGSTTDPLDGLVAGLRLGLGIGDARADAAVCAGVADWRAVARLATYHRVRPLLLEGLACPAARATGSGLEERLRWLRVAPRRRGLGQIAALAETAGALAGRGIDCIVLKGLPLSQRLHGNPLARESIDIDLLVAPASFEAAAETLLQGGWRQARPDFRQTPRRKRWHDRLVKDSLFVRPLGERGGALAVELHRRLLNNPFLFDAPFERLRADGATQTVAGRAYRVLGDGQLLPYLAYHGLEHYWHRLKWLCDIAAAVAALDEDRFGRVVADCRGRGLGAALGSALGLCARALCIDPPPAARGLPLDGRRAKLVARLARRQWDGERPGGRRWMLRSVEGQAVRFALKADPRYVLFELARLMIAPHELGRPDLPDRWLWLVPLLRPVAWTARALGRLRGAGRNSADATQRRGKSTRKGAAEP